MNHLLRQSPIATINMNIHKNFILDNKIFYEIRFLIQIFKNILFLINNILILYIKNIFAIKGERKPDDGLDYSIER